MYTEHHAQDAELCCSARQTRGLINNGSLLLAPLGLLCYCMYISSLCSLPANLPLFSTLSVLEDGCCFAFTWMTQAASPQQDQRNPKGQKKKGGEGAQCPWGPVRPEWMVAFTAINSLLPNYLIHRTHAGLLCTVKTPTRTHTCTLASHRSHSLIHPSK